MRLAVEADLPRLGAPALAEVFGGDALLLGLAGRERRHLAGAGGGIGTGRLEDLLAALGELAQVGVGEALDLGDAVADRLPLHAEPLAQLMAEVCLIDVAGGLGVVEDRRVVEAGPAPVRSLGRVGDQDVGVELGVAGPGGAVLEGGGEEARAVEEFMAAGAAARPAGLALHVGEGGCYGVAVGLVDLDRRLVAAERPEQRDGLRGGKGEVEAGDRSLAPDGTHPERLAVERDCWPVSIAVSWSASTLPARPSSSAASPIQRPSASPSPE